MDKKRICNKLFSVGVVLCLVAGISFGAKITTNNSTHLCYQSHMNSFMRVLPFEACSKFPGKEISFALGAKFLLAGQPIPALASVLGGWGVSTIQAGFCNALKESYSTDYTELIDRNFPSTCDSKSNDYHETDL
jgi:hypothetical protein